MKPTLLLSASILCLCFLSKAQLTKHNFLIGGTGTFSYDNTKFTTGEISSTQIDIAPKIGYFIANRFALGLFGNYGRSSTKSNNIKANYTTYGIGPFVRYYFLPLEERTNILIETNGAYNQQGNSTITAKSEFISYNALLGPVIFLNSSVGLEFLVGYKGYKEAQTDTKNDGITINIGIQFHLERDK